MLRTGVPGRRVSHPGAPRSVPGYRPRRTPGGTTFERSLPGGSDEYVNRPGAALHDDALVEVTRDDLAWIVEHSRERGVPVVLIAYGLPNGPYGNATFGIRAAAEATGAPLVESSQVALDLFLRLQASEADQPALYDDTVHPTQPLYEAVGDRVIGVVDELGLLPGKAPPN